MGSTGTAVSSGSGAGGLHVRGVVGNNPPPVVQPVNAGNPQVQQQAPNAQNTPVTSNAVTNLTQMDDASLAALVRASQQAQLPNFLNDTGVGNLTQQFVFQAGINEKPMVLDANAYQQFMSDNNISPSQQLARSVDPVSYVNNDGTHVSLSSQRIIDIMQNSRLNYIGGKRGGAVHGYGTYFDMNGGMRTGYGGTTAVAVLNPATARVISESRLYSRASTWANSHPQTVRALGTINRSNQSIYALMMGYNVVQQGSGGSYDTYHVVLDRSALVYRK